MHFFSDVSLRYSLGPNPRGVTEYGFRYSIVRWLISSFNIGVVVTHACIVASMYNGTQLVCVIALGSI